MDQTSSWQHLKDRGLLDDFGIVVDNHTARDDNDARFNTFVDVVGGPHEGRRGHYFETVDYDPGTGYPANVFVRARDSSAELLEVAYKHIRPSRYAGGR